jgi:hypothetical protein
MSLFKGVDKKDQKIQFRINIKQNRSFECPVSYFYLQCALIEMTILLAKYISIPCSIDESVPKLTFKLCVIYEELVGTWSG